MRRTDLDFITRRGFLKGTASLCAAASLYGCSKSDGDTYISGEGSDGGSPPVSVEEKVYSAACRANCQSNCALRVHVRNGRIVRTSRSRFAPENGLELDYNGVWQPIADDLLKEAYADYERICLRGLSQVQRIYSTERLKYPLMRKEGAPRGKADSFIRVSWDTALNRLVDEIMQRYDENDGCGRKIMKLTSSGNYGALHGYGGAGAIQSAMLQTTSGVCFYDYALPWGVSKVTGLGTFPFATGNELRDMKKAKYLFLWGSNMAEAHMVGWKFVLDGRKENGGNIEKVISIDVMANSTNVKSDLLYRVRPGSDAALAMSMISYVIEEDLLDKAFMLRNSDAYFLIYDRGNGAHAYLREQDLDSTSPTNNCVLMGISGNTVGASSSTNPTFNTTRMEVTGTPADYKLFDDSADGQGWEVTLDNGTTVKVKTSLQYLKENTWEFHPDTGKATEYTGVSAANIKTLADMYAEGPTTVYLGFGCSHHYNSHYFGHAVAALATITGNMCKEGASVGNFFCQYPTRVDSTAPISGITDPSAATGGGSVGLASFAQQLRTSGKSDITMLMISHSNPMSNNANTKNDYVDTIFNEKYMDFIVTQELNMTETALYSDLVLPVCHWFEIEELFTGSKHSFAVYQEKVSEPMYESMSDMDIARLLFDRLRERNGYLKRRIDSKMYVDGRFKTDWEFIREFLDGSPYTRITPEKLKAMKTVKIADPDHKHMGLENVRVHPKTRKVKPINGGGEVYTPSSTTGRLQLFFDSAGSTGEQFVRWQAPSDAWSGPLDEFSAAERATREAYRNEYPLMYMQEHTRWRVHTQWTTVPWLREFDPEPVIKINPATARAKGISTGDLVKIFNERGHAVFRAILTDALPEDMVNAPKGWERQYFKYAPYEDGTPASYNDMTNPAINPNVYYGMGDLMCFDARVKLEKFEG